MRLLVVMLLGFGLLAGCNEKPPEKTVFDSQVQALKKAKQLEQKVLDDAQKQREQIDQATSSEK